MATNCSSTNIINDEEAATKVQKLFKGHRTRRSLADSAIVVEELWWKLFDSASLDRRSVSFFRAGAGATAETAASRWSRAGKRVARVGRGLCHDGKAQKLALRHWLEAIDPRHRYGHNLHLYYAVWFASSSTQPFFYWLDVGAGREVHHPACPRPRLNSQLVVYLGIKERAAYEVDVITGGRLVYRHTGALVDTTTDDDGSSGSSSNSKWIFVLSTTRTLYVGRKKKGEFQHSSFLAGGATSAAGRLVVKQGFLQAVWPYSGHYRPTEDNFNELIAFLRHSDVDLTNVKRCSVDDDDALPLSLTEQQQSTTTSGVVEAEGDELKKVAVEWASGGGARIGCVRDYSAELQSAAVEQVDKYLMSSSSSPRRRKWRRGREGEQAVPSPRPKAGVLMMSSPRMQQYYHHVGGSGVATTELTSPSGVARPMKQQCIEIRAPAVRLTLPNKNRAK